MRPAEIRRLRNEYEEVPVENFRANWNRLKKTITRMKECAARDKLMYQADRLLYPIDNTRWDGSEAQKLLKQDIDNDFHIPK